MSRLHCLPLLSAPSLHLPNITEVWRATDLPGLDDYLLRALSLLGPTQFLVLPEQHRCEALELQKYHRELGLSTAGNHQLVFTRARPDHRFVSELRRDEEAMATLRRLPVQRIEPFLATEACHALAEELGLRCDMPSQLAERLNHKAEARALLARAGIATPGGVLVERGPGFLDQVLAEVDAVFSRGYGCALTLPHAFSGLGIRRVKSRDDAERVLRGPLSETHALLVEPWLDGVTRSPSAVLYLADERDGGCTITTTDQLLSDLSPSAGPSHVGNAVPSRHLPAGLVNEVADCLWHAGARGIVGVDFIERDGELLVTELNARQTGAIYGALAALRITGGDERCLIHNNVPVPRGTTLAAYVHHLELAGLHFDPRTRSGVIVISQASMRTGKAMVVAVGDAADRPDLFDRLPLQEVPRS
jgi:PGM1 C-terminal domain/ATP-grasp domain